MITSMQLNNIERKPLTSLNHIAINTDFTTFLLETEREIIDFEKSFF